MTDIGSILILINVVGAVKKAVKMGIWCGTPLKRGESFSAKIVLIT
jgi:hypothetical protein